MAMSKNITILLRYKGVKEMKKYAVVFKNEYGYNLIIIDDAQTKNEALDLALTRYNYLGDVAGVTLLYR